MKTKGLLFLCALAFLMCSCEKENVKDSYLVGHEIIISNPEGEYRTSKYYSDCGKELLSEDIYFEGGVYWTQTPEAEADLVEAFQYVHDLVKEDFAEYGYSISFSVFDPAAANGSGTKGAEGYTFNAMDVEGFVAESKAIVAECRECIPESYSFIRQVDELEAYILNFADNPTMENFQNASSALISMPFSDLFHLEIAEGGVKDDEQLRDIESRLDQIARECLSMTDKYKAIFNSNSTMGAAKALVNGKDVYIRWIQLWEGGPKFAEFNWKVENIKPYHDGEMWCIEDFGCFSREEWGLNWRFPTMEELGDETNHRGLIYECTCEWIQNDYGISPNAGLLCTGKGEFSGNSIFLPAMGSEASYITSTLRKRAYTGTSNYFLYISPDEAVMKIDRDIKPGLLRPVLNEGDMEPE